MTKIVMADEEQVKTIIKIAMDIQAALNGQPINLAIAALQCLVADAAEQVNLTREEYAEICDFEWDNREVRVSKEEVNKEC